MTQVRRNPHFEAKLNVARELDYTREQLIRKAASLSDTLKRLATDLAHDNDAGFNGLGVVQGQGAEVDRLCGELKQLRQVHKWMHEAGVREEAARINAEAL